MKKGLEKAVSVGVWGVVWVSPTGSLGFDGRRWMANNYQARKISQWTREFDSPSRRISDKRKCFNFPHLLVSYLFAPKIAPNFPGLLSNGRRGCKHSMGVVEVANWWRFCCCCCFFLDWSKNSKSENVCSFQHFIVLFPLSVVGWNRRTSRNLWGLSSQLCSRPSRMNPFTASRSSVP